MNVGIMKFRSVKYASVCSVLLAASAAAPAVAGVIETSPNAIAVKAFDTLSSGDAKGAVLLFNEAIETRKLSPEVLARALLNRALARQKLGHYKKAIGDYEAALKIDALDAHARAIALYNRGLAWRGMGRQGRAIEDFTSALFLDPYFARAYYSRANILHKSGQFLFALADYEKALKYKYARPWQAHYAMALIYETLDRKRDAREALYAALKAKPSYAPARNRLAALLNGEKGVSFASLAPAKPAAKRHSLVTASLGHAGGADLNLRKKPLPAPVAPPALAKKTPASSGTPVRDKAPARKAVDKPLLMASAKAVVKPEHAPGKAVAPQVKPAPARQKATASAKVEVSVRPANAPAPARIIHAAEAKKTTVAGDAAKVKWSGWAIQISSQRSEEAAWNHWKKLKAKVSRTIRGARPVVMKAEIKGRGVYYRLRLVGYGNRKLPGKLCARLKRRGTSCLVTRAGS